MPKKRLLTQMTMPKGSPKRWRKKYKGKLFYFRGEYAVLAAA